MEKNSFQKLMSVEGLEMILELGKYSFENTFLKRYSVHRNNFKAFYRGAGNVFCVQMCCEINSA